LLALVLALVIHYYEEDLERKKPEQHRASENTPEYLERKSSLQSTRHKEQPQPNFHQSTWDS
jgi:hypothetical protein